MSVIGFFCSCIREGDVATDRWFAGCDRAMMCVLPLAINCIQAFCACFEEHPIISGESSTEGTWRVWCSNRQHAGWVYQLSKVTGSWRLGGAEQNGVNICCPKHS